MTDDFATDLGAMFGDVSIHGGHQRHPMRLQFLQAFKRWKPLFKTNCPSRRCVSRTRLMNLSTSGSLWKYSWQRLPSVNVVPIRLQPAGGYAANLLGLSDQVPMKIVF